MLRPLNCAERNRRLGCTACVNRHNSPCKGTEVLLSSLKVTTLQTLFHDIWSHNLPRMLLASFFIFKYFAPLCHSYPYFTFRRSEVQMQWPVMLRHCCGFIQCLQTCSNGTSNHVTTNFSITYNSLLTNHPTI